MKSTKVRNVINNNCFFSNQYMITTNYYSLFGRNKNTIWHSLTWEEAEFLKWQFFCILQEIILQSVLSGFCQRGLNFVMMLKNQHEKIQRNIITQIMKTSKINCYVTVCILSLTPKVLRMKYYFWLEEIFCFLEMMVIFFSNIIAQFVLVW